MVKAYIIAAVIAALMALWLVRGIVQYGAARQAAMAAKIDAQAHKIEIRRTNPIIHGKWQDRKKAATATGKAFGEPEPVETQTVEFTLGEAIEIEPGISIILN